MKKIMCIFAALLAVVASSCQKAKIFYASVEKIEVSAKGGEGNVVLASDVEKFQVNEVPDWMTTTINENVLTYNVTENTSGDVRTGNLVVSVPGKELTIAVSQGSCGSYINCSEKSITLEKAGGSQEISIDTDAGALEVNVSGDDASCFNASYANGKLTVSAGSNDGGRRKASLQLSCLNKDGESIVIPIDIVQKGNVCGVCGGSGRITCRSCGGSGLNRNWDIESYVCLSCGGRSGYSDGSTPDKRGRGWNRCKACGGTGEG